MDDINTVPVTEQVVPAITWLATDNECADEEIPKLGVSTPSLHEGSDDERMALDRSETISDPDYCGVDEEADVLCGTHGKFPEKSASFDEVNNGRRFYGCAIKDGSNCGFLKWVDDPWSEMLQMALSSLWLLCKDIRKCPKRKSSYVGKTIQVRLLETEVDNSNLKTELGQLKDEKRKLQCVIEDLKTAQVECNSKIKRMKLLCNE
ncbi:hypothetical protein ACQ4PT_014306 [Festuca glaucescens]